MTEGYYLRPDIYVRPGDGIYVLRDTEDGLSDFKWEKLFDLVKPITTGVGTYIANKGQQQQYQYYPQYSQGAYASFTSQGASGQIDTTTIMIIAAVGLVAVMAMRK